jgi:hypothetical protein
VNELKDGDIVEWDCIHNESEDEELNEDSESEGSE